MKSFFCILSLVAGTNCYPQVGSGNIALKSSPAISLNLSFKQNIDNKSTGSTYSIGQNYAGGIVFYVNPDGLHGLIAETRDQSFSSSWYEAQEIINSSINHSALGKNFSDWRLPTKNELDLMFLQRKLLGGFIESGYWSTTEGQTPGSAWYLDFHSGAHYEGEAYGSLYIRAVREF